MARRKAACMALSLAVLLAAASAQASETVTVQVTILEGFSISGPGNIIIGALAPEEQRRTDMELNVWSNVPWELSVTLAEGSNPPMKVEVQDMEETWVTLSGTKLLYWNQDVTGSEGRVIKVPIRCTGTYGDLPGNYSFRLEFTVVPAL
jgi:hypothetical protein